MLAALLPELQRLGSDPRVRIVVLAGAGKHFCAGHDLREVREHVNDRAWQRALFQGCNQMMLTLQRLPQPVIARVQGVAVAAGCQLVSMCDLAVASKQAQFGLPGIKSGLFCTTPGVGVARNLPRKFAMEMLLTGDLIDAETAHRRGLINRVVEPGELDLEIGTLAQRISTHSPTVVGIGKRRLYEQVEKGIDEAYDIASEGMVCNLMLDDATEGIEAFLTKRAPQWRCR
jgi:enoyl-CoA hydratase/carnithine racemase